MIADNRGDRDAAGGGVSVSAGELVELRDGSQIRSSAFGKGDSGGVGITTSRLLIDGFVLPTTSLRTGIVSQAESNSGGDAGAISITAGDVELINSGRIDGRTAGTGQRGQRDGD